jgi:DNA-binding NtrC family response regulator
MPKADELTRTHMLGTRPRIRGGAFCLVQQNGHDAGRVLPLDSAETVLGASPQAGITLDSPGVSRRHFAIIKEGADYLARDLQSKNGTFVDDLRIREAYLQPGALLSAGELLFRFEPVFEDLKAEAGLADFGGLVGEAPAMREIFGALCKVAPTRSTVVLCGATGTGKGAVARAIHRQSPWCDGPFEVFDCAAVTASLVESELFGHERGAFTGAVGQRIGALEAAKGGTLLIDELSDLPPELQPKLLRALEEGEFKRVGGQKPLAVDCRIIAATQADLWAEVVAGRFRRDLYFRLAVVTIPLPPLCDRREAIAPLVDHFLAALASPRFPNFQSLDPAWQQALVRHDWPGNIRELRNAVERLTVMGKLELGAALPKGDATAFDADLDAPFKVAKQALNDAFEHAYLRRLIARCQNNVARAAREAQVDRKHLYSLLEKYHLIGNDTTDA